jgi:transcriptional regulator
VAGSDPGIPGYPHTTLFFVRGSKSSENHGSCEHSGFSDHYLLLSKRKCDMMIPVGNPKSDSMTEKADVLQGTLALMALKTLDVLGPLHGYGIARRIEQISGDLLAVNQGTLYPVLLKLEQEGAISSEWGASENNRRARFYRLTRSGRKLLETQTRDWEQTAAIIARFFEVKAEDLT